MLFTGPVGSLLPKLASDNYVCVRSYAPDKRVTRTGAMSSSSSAMYRLVARSHEAGIYQGRGGGGGGAGYMGKHRPQAT